MIISYPFWIKRLIVKKFYNELIEEENDEDQKMIWMAKISAINDLLTKIKTVIK